MVNAQCKVACKKYEIGSFISFGKVFLSCARAGIVRFPAALETCLRLTANALSEPLHRATTRQSADHPKALFNQAAVRPFAAVAKADMLN
jgi:hypothetical protein